MLLTTSTSTWVGGKDYGWGGEAARRLVVTGVSASSEEEEAKYLDKPRTDYITLKFQDKPSEKNQLNVSTTFYPVGALLEGLK